jgi:putative methyltransferase (TIGR04325 family)
MNPRIKQLLVGCLPPFAIEALHRWRNTIWSGRYLTWEEAKAASTGYESELILARVKDALLKVKDGEAVYERDSVLFLKTQYSWPLLAGLMWIAAQYQGNLNLLDFGGSLGSTYFQNKKFLLGLPRVSWNIVEQPHFVAEGKLYFETETIRFYDDIESCVREKNPHTVLFSGVLQYLENPYAILERVKALAFPFILFDRTAFIDAGTDRLTIQRVPPTIYPGSYPCWFFSRRKFTSFFEDSYELVEEFDALAGVMHLEGKEAAIDKGFILKRRS